ncbi:MAG: hypothetical protein HC892_21065 [Saprospiraceae bacterium]|nr:hypothetical protein [Saprospiraceae bacterium]
MLRLCCGSGILAMRIIAASTAAFVYPSQNDHRLHDHQLSFLEYVL